MRAKTTSLAFALDAEFEEKIRALSEQEGVSISQLIRDALVEKYFPEERETKKKKPPAGAKG